MCKKHFITLLQITQKGIQKKSVIGKRRRGMKTSKRRPTNPRREEVEEEIGASKELYVSLGS